MPLFLFYNLHIFIGCADKYVGHTSRSSRSQMLFKIGAPKNFANFTGKHLCWSLFEESCRPSGHFVYRTPPVVAFVSQSSVF